ncbi:hypothetical protein ACSER0_26355 [Pseudomonas aeruginosa]
MVRLAMRLRTWRLVSPQSGKLLALTSAEGELDQETAERLGWFLEEVGGAIYQLAEFEQVCSARIDRQKEAQQ